MDSLGLPKAPARETGPDGEFLNRDEFEAELSTYQAEFRSMVDTLGFMPTRFCSMESSAQTFARQAAIWFGVDFAGLYGARRRHIKRKAQARERRRH